MSSSLLPISRVLALAFAVAACLGCGKTREAGEPQVDGADVFARNGSFVRSAEAAGYSFADLIHRVVHEASRRYGAGPTPHTARGESGELTIVPINDRRVAAK